MDTTSPSFWLVSYGPAQGNGQAVIRVKGHIASVPDGAKLVKNFDVFTGGVHYQRQLHKVARSLVAHAINMGLQEASDRETGISVKAISVAHALDLAYTQLGKQGLKNAVLEAIWKDPSIKLAVKQPRALMNLYYLVQKLESSFKVTVYDIDEAGIIVSWFHLRKSDKLRNISHKPKPKAKEDAPEPGRLGYLQTTVRKHTEDPRDQETWEFGRLSATDALAWLAKWKAREPGDCLELLKLLASRNQLVIVS